MALRIEPELVVEKKMSSLLLIKASKAAALPPTSTTSTSSHVRLPYWRPASTDSCNAGEPFTKAARLPLRSSIFSTPRSAAQKRLRQFPPIEASIIRTRCGPQSRSEEPSELQSLMRISYAVFCLKKKKKQVHNNDTQRT